MMVPKVAVVLEIPTPYRQPVFELLAVETEVQFHFFYLSRSQRDRFWNVELFQDCGATYLKGFQICFPGFHTIHVNFGMSETLLRPFYDAYVIGGYAQPAVWTLLRHCWGSKTPYVMFTESHLGKRRSDLLHAAMRGYLRKIYKLSGANLVTSSAARTYIELHDADPKTIFLLPNSVDGPRYAELVRTKREESQQVKERLGLGNSRIVLFVGALNRRKGVDKLIRAFSSILAQVPGTALVLVGAGTLEKELRSEVDVQGLKDKVIFTGFIQPDRLALYYGMADIFVLPSLEEPFGAVICEAMSAGLPIVATKAVGAVSDFVREGENGFVVPPGNVSILAERLKRLLVDRITCESMGRRSSEMMSEWTARRMADNFTNSVKVAIEGGSCLNSG